MREKNITQQQLADHMKKSRGGIGHWLTGRREPSMEEAQKIAAFLQVSYGWLFASEGEREPGYTPPPLSEPVVLGKENTPAFEEWADRQQTGYDDEELRRIRQASEQLKRALERPRNERALMAADVVLTMISEKAA